MIVKRNRAEALVLGVDGRLAHQLNDRMSLVGSVGIGYDKTSNPNSVTAAFAPNPNATFVTYGVNPKPWLGRAGLGAVYKIKDRLEANARYDVDYRENFLNQTASANIRWMF